MKERRQIVLKLQEDADIAFRTGRPNAAIAIKSKLFDDYSRYKDLSDLFPAPPVNVPGAPASDTSPQPDASSPSQPAAPTREGEPRATATPPRESAEPPAKSKRTDPPPES
jgi:hypothetical protein